MSGEYISRETAIVMATRDLFDGQTADYVACDIKEKLNAIPAADVVEVVRCKECSRKYSCRAFTIWAVPPDDNWYCADGEKKEDAP